MAQICTVRDFTVQQRSLEPCGLMHAVCAKAKKPSFQFHGKKFVQSCGSNRGCNFQEWSRCRVIHRTAVPIRQYYEHTTEVVTVACPAGFTGHIARECGQSGWLSAAIQTHPIGACTRKRCPLMRFNVVSTPANRSAVKLTQVVFPDTAEGTGEVTVKCPTGYEGLGVSAVCASDTNAWSRPKTRCHAAHVEYSQT